MITEDALSEMDYKTFGRIVFLYASSVKRFIRLAHPNAPDPSYVLFSNVSDWGRQFFTGANRETLAIQLETLYRLGVSVEELVGSAQNKLQRESEDLDGSGKPDNAYRWTTHRTFKYVAGLFAFRILSYSLQNTLTFPSSIVVALPPATHTLIDLVMKEADMNKTTEDSSVTLGHLLSRTGRIEWNSTQPILAALFLTLESKGYFLNMPGYALIKAVFTNANSIDQMMRPGTEDGKARYDRIPDKLFKLFSGIKQNPQLPNGKNFVPKSQ
jgi:hypothetical protein